MTEEQIAVARKALLVLLMDVDPEEFSLIEETYNVLGLMVGLPPEELYERD